MLHGKPRPSRDTLPRSPTLTATETAIPTARSTPPATETATVTAATQTPTPSEVASSVASREASPVVEDQLLGTWELNQIDAPPGNIVQPDDPARYTVTFRPDDMVVVVADCKASQGMTLTLELPDDGGSVRLVAPGTTPTPMPT
jgi:hypothetical protein